MSRKRYKAKQAARPGDGQSGGLTSNEPLKVNWYVIGGAVILVGALVLFSMQQAGELPQAGGSAGSAGSGDCAPTTKQWSAPPAMQIDTAKTYTATFTMQKGGQFSVRLFDNEAPITVNNFVFLAREGFFDCVTFHRVLDGFMAQGGDPTGSGSGGPGYQFQDETDNGLVFDRAGLLAMANSNQPQLGITDTNGSQFFITYAPTEWLNGNHTIFGEVTAGMEVVNGLTRRDPNTAPDFNGDLIASVTITES